MTSFFQGNLPLATDEPGSLEQVITYEPIHVSHSTFRAGLAQHFHRWFRLTPSFGPDLVREMLVRMDTERNHTVLDPFAGASTTLIEARLEGIDALGLEINPFLQFVGRVSLDWSVDADACKEDLFRLKEQFHSERNKISFDNLSDYDVAIPSIHNPFRWWREDVLLELLLLKSLIYSIENAKSRDLLALALAAALVPDLTNVTLGRLQLHFIDRTNDNIDVFGVFCHKADTIISDIGTAESLSELGNASVFHRDALVPDSYSFGCGVDRVITSPPYPNRYSYVWNTRPHLYLFDFFTTKSDGSTLDRNTVGGTWGTATSELQRGVWDPEPGPVADAIGGIVDSIRERSNLMANYVAHYFNRLAKQIQSMDGCLNPGARIAYVVGNSWTNGVYVPTDILLSQIMRGLTPGYKIEVIHRFRRRHSGKNLYESIVYAKRTV